MTYEEALGLPRAIGEHGVEGEGKIRRLILFNEIGRSPGSSSSRTLIASAARYALTLGNYNSDFLELTENGKEVLIGDPRSDQDTLRLGFELAIKQFEPFNSLYEQLKSKRIPADSVLHDLMGQHGVGEDDCEQAASIFIENARFVGLVQNQTGNDYIIPLEQALEESAVDAVSDVIDVDDDISSVDVDEALVESPVELTSRQRSFEAPTVHIDVQIHIDSSAEAHQIDQIFASMAKHLYGVRRD